MPDTKVKVTFEFTIPEREMVEVDLADLRSFIANELGVNEWNEVDQFRRYNLGDFKPRISELIVNSKVLISK